MTKVKSQKSRGEAGKQVYRPAEIESRWQRIWEKEGIFEPDLERAEKPFYNLMMFPYPSAEGLHVGGIFTFGGIDAYGRFKRMQGFDVFEPIGLDGFGINAENHAIKTDSHPIEHAKRTQENFYRQLKATGNGYAWKHKVETYDSNYYKWTQWLFTELFKAGLAYRKKASVNFCSKCKTVLADEQVVKKIKDSQGKSFEEEVKVCERCETVVERRDLEQWFFGITKYADRLLGNIDGLDWSEKVKVAQRNWIGKSEGLLFTAPVKNSSMKIQTFSAHFEAFFADTFVVIAPDHPLLGALIEDVPNKEKILAFCAGIIQKRDKDPYEQDKEPQGIFTGKYIVDPVGNGDLPIWVANYALKDYGTGIVKCSAHDERDFAFAKKYGIRLKVVLFPKDVKLKKKVENLEVCYTDMQNGYLLEPIDFVGKSAGRVRSEILQYAVEKGFAKPISQYHLRDWLISRQRYWGPPIPMIYCDNCAKKGQSWFSKNDSNLIKRLKVHWDAGGWYPVELEDLPVELPFVEDYKPLGTGKSPLANYPDFYTVICPACGSEAVRETDVSDTFLDSAWYFLRYISSDRDDVAFDSELVNKWLPVSMYIGGAEHSVLHLLYARFITMVLCDLGYVGFEEPFKRFYAHGLIIKDGAKMSKSKGNVINPDDYVRKYGADALRMYLLFLGPFNEGGDFRDTGIEGMHRFLKKVWRFFLDKLQTSNFKLQISGESVKMMHQSVKGITEDMESLRFNTAISNLMIYYNFLAKQESVCHEEISTYLRLLAPFAPYMAEEIWERLKSPQPPLSRGRIYHNWSVHRSEWPRYDPTFLIEDEVSIVVQVDGKVRDVLRITNDELRVTGKPEKLARNSEKVKKFLDGRVVRKVVYVEGKVMNFVIV